MFDHDIADFAKQKKWTVVEILHQSKYKKTAILKIIVNKKICIAKVHLKSAPMATREAFASEVKYYSLLSGVVNVPALIESGDEYLLLEYVCGKSIWSLSLHSSTSQKKIINIASEVKQTVLDFNSITSSKIIKMNRFEAYRLILGRLKDLFLSGPIGTSAHFYKRLQLTCLYYLSFPLIMFSVIKHVPKLIEEKNMSGCRYHGDLHMNNLLYDDRGKVHLIDFERAKERPLVFLDLAYSCATFIAAFQHKDEVMQVFNGMFDSCRPASHSFSWLLNLFVTCAQLNPRFCSGSIVKIKFITFLRIIMCR